MLSDPRLLAVEAVDGARRQLASGLRRSIGLTEEPPPPCDDPSSAYIPPSSPVRIVHSDLTSMLVGGVASLLLQMLHPLAMAGVADHSAYREDPLGRLERTAMFVGTTSFRSTEEATAAIERVRRIHRVVTGIADDGTPYRADDPKLLEFVHNAEVSCFLAAYRRYGTMRLSENDQDAYVADMAQVALDLGALEVPRKVAELDRAVEAVRSDLRLTRAGSDARNFVMLGPLRAPHEMAAYSLVVAAGVGILPPWARRALKIPQVPLFDPLWVRPATRLLGRGIRFVVPPLPAQVAMVSPPSTATT